MQMMENIIIIKMCDMKVLPSVHPMLLKWKNKNDVFEVNTR